MVKGVLDCTTVILVLTIIISVFTFIFTGKVTAFARGRTDLGSFLAKAS